MPESEIDTPHIGDGVCLNTSVFNRDGNDAHTRPKGGFQTVMPRRKRRRRNVRTADSTSAMDISQESVAPPTEDSEKIHKMPECITKGEPKLEAAPLASHDMASHDTVQITVARTHYLWGVGASVRPDTIIQRENLRRK